MGIDVAVAGDFVVAGVAGLGGGEQNTLVRTTRCSAPAAARASQVEADRFVVRDGALVSTESFAGSGLRRRPGHSGRQRTGRGRRAVSTPRSGEDAGAGRGGDLRVDAGTLEVANGVIRP